MEFKPGNGFNANGYIDPKKRAKMVLVLIILFLGGVFTLTAMVYSWWSIIVDIGIILYLILMGRIGKDS